MDAEIAALKSKLAKSRQIKQGMMHNLLTGEIRLVMKISTILDHIDSGHMALPEFQRGYVWNRDQVRGLFGSLYRRHPVGGCWSGRRSRRPATHRGDGPLAAGVVKLLLDGQQRMTSLYGAVRGKPPKFFDGNAAAFTGLRFHLETETFAFYQPVKCRAIRSGLTLPS